MSEQKVFVTRRNYNRWVANQTLEDYALRFTAKNARRWSASRVSNTALGALSFLALEAIGGTITLLYGFDNALYATLVVSLIIFLTGLPISYYAAKYGVDIDLLTRGAGFGYIGSTLTSLIYASFTFIFFALEAAIMSSALELLFDIPLTIGYLLSTLVVIPLVTHGITVISRFQMWTQPFWILLQVLPFVFILHYEWQAIPDWVNYPGEVGLKEANSGFNLLYFGAAASILFSLMAQIGEQVDFLRFLPPKTKQNRYRWWTALIAAGPGWIIIGAIKILAGSFLAILALKHGVNLAQAGDPTYMYVVAFGYLTQSPQASLALAGLFVILCQLKINVTNAYAGSIAWSNFFSRLTHSHPGRVVWLVFNVMIALLIMELGIYESLSKILGIYSNVAVAWVGAIVADLVVNKPLGLSPKHIEFKRAHLYDINPVGFGSMMIASTVGVLAYVGVFGPLVQAIAPFISLVVAFILVPLIAMLTRGRYYLAREPHFQTGAIDPSQCIVCENEFEAQDMSHCPAYGGAICSLCCTLDARCHDQCKEGARFSDQIAKFITFILPEPIALKLNRRWLQFFGFLLVIASIIAMLFWLVYLQTPPNIDGQPTLVSGTLIQVYLLLMIIIGVLIWLFVLANESRELALEESQRQTLLLSKEIKAHEKTDQALQKAKEAAEAANQAKSRYLTGISHELRSPLNSVLGYAQLLEKDSVLSTGQKTKVGLIKRNGEHLSDLIEGLLDISRIEVGRLELRREEVHLKAMLNDLIEMYQLQAEAKGLVFNHSITKSLPECVYADEKQLRQILINLLSNAIKYTEHGSITLTVSYRSQVAEFLIEDTGSGIAPEDQERIFRPFERIRKPGAPQIVGTGLGLTITKLLTEIMGGELQLKSEEGCGSKFRLMLMLSKVYEPSIKPEIEKQITSYVGPKKTIMVVDDDPSHRGLVSEILTPLGFVVIEATDAENGLSMLEAVSIDLFLLDISMPGMTGWELMKRLRERGCTQPIMMVSADSTEHLSSLDSDDVRPLHNDYLVKPIRDLVLIEKVGKLLQIDWRYQPKASENPFVETAQLNTEVIGVPKTLSGTDLRLLISMAELGYVKGIEDIINRLKKQKDTRSFLDDVEDCLKGFQFHEIIRLCKKALDE